MTLLVDASSAASLTTPLLHSADRRRGIYRIVQVDISAAATVLIQGRLSQKMSWTTIETFTFSEAKSVALFTHMRVSFTGNTGVVSVEIDT